MSKEDLIELQGVVVEVLAGGNYKIKMQREPRGAGPAQRQDAAVPDPRDPGRPRDRRRLALRPEARPHHLPRQVARPAPPPRRPLRPRPHPSRLRPGRARRPPRRPSRASACPVPRVTVAAYQRINDDAVGRLPARRDHAARPSPRERFRRLLAASAAPARRAPRLGDDLPRPALARAATACPAAGRVLRALRRALPPRRRHERHRPRAARPARGLAASRRYFEVVVTSQGCGYAKPDPRILHVALARARASGRGDALYVGDDAATDGGAAAAARRALRAGSTAAASRPRPRPRHVRLRTCASCSRSSTGAGLRGEPDRPL